MKVTTLSRTTLLAFLGTQEATIRRIPGGTDFHLPISSGPLFDENGFAGWSGESLEREVEDEDETDSGRRSCLRLPNGAIRMRGRGAPGGRRQGRHGRGGLGSFQTNISLVVKGWPLVRNWSDFKI
jgi:hypothetical protein